MTHDISAIKKLLDEINAAISSYDPTLKDQAREILLKAAFGENPITGGQTAKAGPQLSVTNGEKSAAQNATPFNALIEKWSPTTQADRALLGAYYFQRVLGHQNVTGLQVNKELKQHGFGAANITDCFTTNMNAEPARMLQTKKAGKSKQAKKLYLVTTAGINYVEDRINSSQEG
jgi:hypothetical protein